MTGPIVPLILAGALILVCRRLILPSWLYVSATRRQTPWQKAMAALGRCGKEQP